MASFCLLTRDFDVIAYITDPRACQLAHSTDLITDNCCSIAIRYTYCCSATHGVSVYYVCVCVTISVRLIVLQSGIQFVFSIHLLLDGTLAMFARVRTAIFLGLSQ